MYVSCAVLACILEERGYRAELSKHEVNLKLGISIATCVYEQLTFCLRRGIAAQ